MDPRKALLLAARDLLRASASVGGLALAKADCELAPLDGRPPARCGKRFVGLHAGERRRTKKVIAGIDQTFGLTVTVTMRVDGPLDRVGPDLMERSSHAFDDLVGDVVDCLQRDSYDNRLIRRANVYLGWDPNEVDPDAAAYQRPFVEPLEYESDERPRVVGGPWFGADAGEAQAGMVAAIRFGGARCLRSYLGTEVVGITDGPTTGAGFLREGASAFILREDGGYILRG